jgi:hypothetical protein
MFIAAGLLRSSYKAQAYYETLRFYPQTR